MARARGIEQLAAAVEPWTREATAARCGIEADALDNLLAAIRRHRRLAVQTGTGSSMARHAVATEWLACALQIITGSYEAPGGLWFQPGFLRCFDRRTTRPSPDEGSPVRAVQSRPDLVGLFGEVPCAALADEIDAGNVRALVVVGGNPLTAFPELDRLRAAFAKLDVLCVVDVIETETSRVATHVLPAAGQLERADVPDYVDQYALEVASQYTPAIVPLFADRRPMWWWFGHLGARLGCPVLPDGLDPDDCSDDGILEAIASRARATFDDLRAADGPLIASGPVRGWVHEQVLPGGRWRIAPQPCIDALAEAAREDEPTSLTLVAGRQLATMNSQLRDVTAPGATPERAVVRLHPGDGVAAGLTDGAMVEVRSRTGRTTGVAVFDETIRRGVVHVPHGRTSPEIGALTSTRDGVDPRTGMVLQTAVPVELRALDGAIADERARTW
jgi:anaerobic selenocysteine-containing dehydrogenase